MLLCTGTQFRLVSRPCCVGSSPPPFTHHLPLPTVYVPLSICTQMRGLRRYLSLAMAWHPHLRHAKQRCTAPVHLRRWRQLQMRNTTLPATYMGHRRSRRRSCRHHRVRGVPLQPSRTPRRYQASGPLPARVALCPPRCRPILALPAGRYPSTCPRPLQRLLLLQLICMYHQPNMCSSQQALRMPHVNLLYNQQA